MWQAQKSCLKMWLTKNKHYLPISKHHLNIIYTPARVLQANIKRAHNARALP
jgi:hypothetical protein